LLIFRYYFIGALVYRIQILSFMFIISVDDVAIFLRVMFTFSFGNAPFISRAFPNTEVALLICLSLTASNCSDEWPFSQQK